MCVSVNGSHNVVASFAMLCVPFDMPQAVGSLANNYLDNVLRTVSNSCVELRNLVKSRNFKDNLSLNCIWLLGLVSYPTRPRLNLHRIFPQVSTMYLIDAIQLSSGTEKCTYTGLGMPY
jgi:hypothetical protein